MPDNPDKYYEFLKQVFNDINLNLDVQIPAIIYLLSAFVLIVGFLIFQAIKARNTLKTGILANIKEVIFINNEIANAQKKHKERFDVLEKKIFAFGMMQKAETTGIMAEGLKEIYFDMLEFLSEYSEFLLEYKSYLNYGFNNKYREIYLRNQCMGIVTLYESLYRCCISFSAQKDLEFRYRHIEILCHFICRKHLPTLRLLRLRFGLRY